MSIVPISEAAYSFIRLRPGLDLKFRLKGRLLFYLAAFVVQDPARRQKRKARTFHTSLV